MDLEVTPERLKDEALAEPTTRLKCTLQQIGSVVRCLGASAERAFHVDCENGTAGLLQALETCAALLVAMVTSTSPNARAWHPHSTEFGPQFHLHLSLKNLANRFLISCLSERSVCLPLCRPTLPPVGGVAVPLRAAVRSRRIGRE